MLGRTYERENCSAARTLEIVGERWSLLIIRNALFAGSTRFTEFQRKLGIAPNILSSRLDWFVETGLMQARPVSDDRETREYVLTDKGRALEPVILALTAWGDTWAAPNGPPVIYQHEDCGGQVRLHLRCETCDAELDPSPVTIRPGPGASPGHLPPNSTRRSRF
jgi:DNA-binding HxlR family transcriptional regulator